MKSIVLEDKIKSILEVDVNSRCNDMYLYYQYVNRELNDPDIDRTFITLFRNPKLVKQLGLKTFGAVERIGRELRRNNPNLTVKEVEKFRFEKQQDYTLYDFGYNVNL